MMLQPLSFYIVDLKKPLVLLTSSFCLPYIIVPNAKKPIFKEMETQKDVLIIDDDADIILLLKSILIKAGYHVRQASTIEAVYDCLNSGYRI